MRFANHLFVSRKLLEEVAEGDAPMQLNKRGSFGLHKYPKRLGLLFAVSGTAVGRLNFHIFR